MGTTQSGLLSIAIQITRLQGSISWITNTMRIDPVALLMDEKQSTDVSFKITASVAPPL